MNAHPVDDAKPVYEPLLELVVQACKHWSTDFPAQFYPALDTCSDNWIELRDTSQPAQLRCRAIATRVLDKLDTVSTQEKKVFAPLIKALTNCHTSLYWEQSYTRQDGVVSDIMLEGYTFAELVGSCGPAFSKQIRIGFGLWDAGIHYPQHAHLAEEVYCVLDGTATFTVGSSTVTASAGQAVYVPHNEPHSFITRSSPLLIMYLWQGGDLRQKSVFNADTTTQESETAGHQP